MSSFFFHIALDLNEASSPNNHCLLRGAGIFQSSKTPKKQATESKKKGFGDSAINQGQGQRGHRGAGLTGKEPGPGNLINGKEGTVNTKAVVPGVHDWRYDRIAVQSIDMAPVAGLEKHGSNEELHGHMNNGMGAGPSGLATKGSYEPLDLEQDDMGWGIVRLYRDAEETPGLYDDLSLSKSSRGGRNSLRKHDTSEPVFRDEDCTTLCILAVPSYLTPSDFLGFVGEKTRDEVSHFRMIRTERGNRYMVLMKFRSGKKAREWRKEWNGKAFDGMEPENCHVVFVKSIEFRINETAGQDSSFPDMTNDPFTPSKKPESSTPTSTTAQPHSLPSTSRNTKPQPPPTPALIELPTCPVCLERMDESTGLLTILCQHVFHCSCLQKWRGSGCPVCRYTQDDNSPGKRTSLGETAGLNECTICSSDQNLWICLICGNVGCGRYDAAHAFAHYETSNHCFAMDLATQRIWDYASDGYVHRIVQSKTDGKLVELPASAATDNHSSRDRDDDFDDYVPREKLTNIAQEYTHLLTSQLDSQRMYFDEILERAADKASQASQAAERASARGESTSLDLAKLRSEHDTLLKETLPQLERERDRAGRRAEKFEGMARKLEKEWREEKTMNSSLMERIDHLGKQVDALREEKKELEEQNRDLGFFISGGQKLREFGASGSGSGGEGPGALAEEVREGVVSVGDPPAQKAKKKGGKK